MKEIAIEVWQCALHIASGVQSRPFEDGIADRIKKLESDGEFVEAPFAFSNLAGIPIAESQYQGIIASIEDDNKIAAIKQVMEITGWDLQKSKDYTENVLYPAAGKAAPSSGSGGCYVATAVYGSYDCPEVWTLRRFRDFKLAETVPGRAFIRAYYAISPTVVKWFGSSSWFKSIGRKWLDALVGRLVEQGYESTPYDDRLW